MRTKLRNTLYVLVAAIAITSCGAVQKIIKTGNPDYIYEQALNYYDQEQWGRASTLFGSIQYMYVGSAREDSLSFYYARCQAKSGDYYTAIELIDKFRGEFGRSPFLEDAESMRAMCYYYLSPAPTRDQTLTHQAISASYEFMAHYPESERNEGFLEIIEELQERIYEKSYINAYTYYKIGRYKSAIVAFRNAAKEYPESHRREDILFHVVASSYELAKNSVPSKQLDRYIAMLDSYYTFIAEFPESEEYAKELKKMQKEAQEYVDEHHTPDEEESQEE